MTTIRIDLSDDQAAARAAAQGLTLEAWLRKRAAENAGNPAGAIDWSQCPAVESEEK